MTATGFGRVFFASVLIAFAIVFYATWWMHNVTRATADAVSTGLVVLGVVPASGPEPQAAIRTSKSDKGVFYDAEAAGDIADAAVAAEDKDSSEHMLARLN